MDGLHVCWAFTDIKTLHEQESPHRTSPSYLLYLYYTLRLLKLSYYDHRYNHGKDFRFHRFAISCEIAHVNTLIIISFRTQSFSVLSVVTLSNLSNKILYHLRRKSLVLCHISYASVMHDIK